MGSNDWQGSSEWPLPRTTSTTYDLRGTATQAGDPIDDGALTIGTLGAGEGPQAYVYDPQEPVLTIGGNNLAIPAGGFNQRPAEARPDVVSFSTEPLSKDVGITRPIQVELWASSSALYTDFTARRGLPPTAPFARASPSGGSRSLRGHTWLSRWLPISYV